MKTALLSHNQNPYSTRRLVEAADCKDIAGLVIFFIEKNYKQLKAATRGRGWPE